MKNLQLALGKGLRCSFTQLENIYWPTKLLGHYYISNVRNVMDYMFSMFTQIRLNNMYGRIIIVGLELEPVPGGCRSLCIVSGTH